MKILKYTFFIITLFLILPKVSLAASRYWVGGGSSSNWNATGPTNWGSASNTQDNASVPGSADDVFFDGVGTGASNSTLSANITINSLDMTGYANTLTHNTAVTLTIAGSGVNFKLASGMTYTVGSNTGSVITFTGTSGTTLITTAGKTIGSFVFNGAGGTWQLQDSLTMSGTITLTTGTWDTGNQTVSVPRIDVGGTGVRTLTLGSSAITLTSASTVWVMSAATNLTVTANTSVMTINNTGTWGVATAKNWNGLSLVFTGAGAATLDATGSTFANVTRTGTAVKNDTFVLNSDVIVTGTFTVNGNSSINRVLVSSNTLGTARTITAATVSASNVDFRDITGAGTGSWNLSAITGLSGDAYGNSGITFTNATTTYWTGNTGSWSDATQWCITSGGCADNAGNSRIPLPQDDVVFDNGSFNGTSQTVTLNMPRAGHSIDWSAYNEGQNPTWSTGSGFSLYGSLTLNSGMTWSAGAISMTFESRGTYTFTSSGLTFGGLVTLDAPGGTLTLQDAMSVTFDLTVIHGTFNANNFNVTLGRTFNTNFGGNLRTITMGSGTWTLTGTGSWSVSTNLTNLTLNANTSTIVISNTSATAKTFAGAGVTYNNITFSGDNITVTGANTFNNFAVNTAGLTNGLKLTHGITQNITGTFSTNGSGGSLAKMISDTTTNATLNSSSQVCVDYMSLDYITGTPGGTWNVGANSTDGGHNSGLSFTGCTSTGSVPEMYLNGNALFNGNMIVN